MPDWIEYLRPRLASLQLTATREAEVIDELSQHLDQRYEELKAEGKSDVEASRLAVEELREPDVLGQYMQALRQSHVPPSITPGAPKQRLFGDLWQDARYAARTWRKQPGFAVAAVLTLALGIGANAAIISLVRALYFTPLAVEDPSRVVEINQRLAERPELPFSVSLSDYWYYRDHTRTVPELAAHYPTSPLYLVTGTKSIGINGSVVSANYFSTLRLRPQLGRFFLPNEDEVPDRDPVVVIGDVLWRRELGADPQIVGSTLGINGQTFTIVGVAPPGFMGAQLGVSRSDVWIPTAMFRVGYRNCDALGPTCRILQLVGRLAAGESVASAQAEMDLLAGQLVAASPKIHEGRGLSVRINRGVRLIERDRHAPTARLLLAIVACVLLMACANLAGLLLARNVTRRKEVAIRLALGAGRLRLLRQFLIESLMLALLGGAAGAMMAIWTNSVLQMSFGMTGGADSNFIVSLDWTVVAFTLALSIGTAFVFGLVPAIAALRPDVAPVIKDEVQAAGSARSRVRDALVIAQIAASLIFLAGAGLLARSIAGLFRGPGFDITRVVVLRLRPGLVGYEPSQSRAYQQEAVRRIEAIPGVESASVAQYPPLPGWGPTMTISRVGDRLAQPVESRYNQVGARYFETLGIRIVDGRRFDDRDRPETLPVAIVNEALARRLWPSEAAIGGSLVVSGTPREVVGVVQDAQYIHAGESPEPMLYLSFWQLPATHIQMGDATTHVRVAGDAGTMLTQIRQELTSFDRAVPINFWTLSARVDEAFASVRVTGTLVTYASVIMLFLSATGVYGLLSFAVNQRRREIAIRAALGAERRDLAQLIVRHSAALAGLGVVVGLIGAIWAARLLIVLLYGVQPSDPLSLLAACAAIAAMAVAATWVPMRRAISVDPNIVLRDM